MAGGCSIGDKNMCSIRDKKTCSLQEVLTGFQSAPFLQQEALLDHPGSGSPSPQPPLAVMLLSLKAEAWC